MACDIHVNILSVISWRNLKQQGDALTIVEGWILSRNWPDSAWWKTKECCGSHADVERGHYLGTRSL